MTDDPIAPGFKAMAEIAKTTGKAIDAASGLGRFFDRIFGVALEELGGALADKARYWRLGRLQRLEERYEEAWRELGDESRAAQPVEPKFAIALLEAASLEDDNHLQDMFARLLANATTENTGVEDRRAFVSILAELKPLDARLLPGIYDAPQLRPSDPKTTAGLLPVVSNHRVKITEMIRVQNAFQTGLSDLQATIPSQEVAISLWNLRRLGCIEFAGTWNGMSMMQTVSLTELGEALIRACSIIRPK